MRHVVNLKKAEIYISAKEVMARYSISETTLWRWIKTQGFPAARMIVGKRHFAISEVEQWDFEQSGHKVELEAEKALGYPVVSGVIQNYSDLVDALISRRHMLEMSCMELDARAGMAEGHANKLENWRQDYGRGAGPEIFPLWIGGLRVGVVLVALPNQSFRTKKKPAALPDPNKGRKRGSA
jgi:predicted DNA-binding transcriptional regulator AlpA